VALLGGGTFDVAEKRDQGGRMISLQSLVTVVVYLIVAGLIMWLLWWLIDYVGLPEPFNKVARVIMAIVAVLVIIGILLSLVGGTPVFRP
jgi:hypothetical protein